MFRTTSYKMKTQFERIPTHAYKIIIWLLQKDHTSDILSSHAFKSGVVPLTYDKIRPYNQIYII